MASKRDYFQREDEVYNATQSQIALRHIRQLDSALRRLGSFVTDRGSLLQIAFALCDDDRHWDNITAPSHERQSKFAEKSCKRNTETIADCGSPPAPINSISLVGCVVGIDYGEDNEMILLVQFSTGEAYDVITYADGFQHGVRPEHLIHHSIRFAGVPLTMHRRKSILAYKILDRKAAFSRVISDKFSEEWLRLQESLQQTTQRSMNARMDPEETSRMEKYLERRRPLLEELAQGFQTHWNRLTAEKISDWLMQFGNTHEVAIALKILQHIDYIDDGKMLDIFREFYDKLNIDAEIDLAFTILGQLNESASQVVSKCSKTLSESEQRKISFQSLRDTIKSYDSKRTMLILVEDNVASGTQASQMLEELLAELSGRKTKEYVKTPLTSQEIEWLRKCRKVIYFSLVGMDVGEHLLEETARRYGINLQAYSSVSVERTVGCFSPRSLIWNDRFEREMAMELIFGIGYEILGDKAWDGEKRKERALGYGGLQRLVVFSYSTPTSSLPILWKEGPYRGKIWKPLFPRLP